MEQHDLDVMEKLPAPRSSRVIDFESIEISPGIIPGTYFLIVSGEKPWVTMTVQLTPLIYVRQPEYWEIEVVATQAGIGLPMVAPYHAVLDISYLRGTKGIEVVGATKRERRDV
ncbi:hypothetical protein U1701_06340 [Sphingomonas sp. PB2P19]|uniref:hypothetical protein n=1 Tax=Sphingomonas rhamnosi TaxID=3096156 RepID=UPI002FC737EB